MGRRMGSKDLKKRYRRSTDEIKRQKELKEKEKIKEEIEKEYYLIKKDLVDMTGITYSQLVLALKYALMTRVDSVLKGDENFE